jgi:glycosyltransferase involved in cell wall biosynthesis
MKVLITDFDLFQKVGGGQTFYRALIERHPHIEFYYFITSKSVPNLRHPNTHPIRFQQNYYLKGFYDVTPPRWAYDAFTKASNIAFSVAGQSFDIIDCPDYERFGLFLRPALQYHYVNFGCIALSLHGVISTTQRLNWQPRLSRELEMQEIMQYKTVDIRYGISQSYLDEWRQQSNLQSHYLHPLYAFNLPNLSVSIDSPQHPDINFIGRTEKRKGPDIFVELVSRLPKSSFTSANIIGPPCEMENGISSNQILAQLISHRGLDINIMAAMETWQLSQLFRSHTITLLPSRYDTLNLTAMESLFSGCPAAIGSGAGVCRFLRESYPKVPFINIDINNVYACIPEIYAVLNNYRDYRQRLIDSILAADLQPSGPSIDNIYTSQSQHDKVTRIQLDLWHSQLINFCRVNPKAVRMRIRRAAIWFFKNHTSSALQKKLRYLRSHLHWRYIKVFLKRKLRPGPFRDFVRNLFFLAKSSLLLSHYTKISVLSEATEREWKTKLQKWWEIGSRFRIDRVRLWREMARLESMSNHPLIAVAYLLRAIRAFGYDHFSDLDYVVSTLNAHSFSREAEVVDAMYGNYPDRRERCKSLLEQAFVKNRRLSVGEYVFVDDRRQASGYKVSIIVSLYKAAAKLRLFLEALKLQTMLQAAQAELILIDSSSPEHEYTVFKETMKDNTIPVVYARCAQRETIQSAWNRGIALSHASYLAFLGVDETIMPNCLEILAGELERNPTIDWIVGNSLVTKVDTEGLWISDVMTYDRAGYNQDFVYLETCYLSWVGGLYRRSIHERFGFYDASFKAAGDTEFKNRVLPFIKTKAIPQLLGIFWNYPETRASLSATAEIEDLRAWYLHRTVAGIDYAFSRRSHQEAAQLLCAALHYRKSFCRHSSSDIEYAYNLATYIKEMAYDLPQVKYLEGIESLLTAYRKMDWIPKLSRFRLFHSLWHTLRESSRSAKQHALLSQHCLEPTYRIFNDNRYEQHSNIWFTEDIS